jgi:hypothetical protein
MRRYICNNACMMYIHVIVKVFASLVTLPGWESAHQHSSPWFDVGVAPIECGDWYWAGQLSQSGSEPGNLVSVPVRCTFTREDSPIGV